MKGQFFIIAAVIILIGFILLKNSLGIFDTLVEKRIVESSLMNKQAVNIANEYKYLAGVASLQNDVNRSAIDYLYNFSSFLRDDRDVEILYVFVYVNDSANTYSVTVGNFINDNINASINVTASAPQSVNFTLNDKKNVTYNFAVSSEGIININLTYRRIDTSVTERLSIDSRKNMTSFFIDLTLVENNKIRVKDVYNVTI